MTIKNNLIQNFKNYFLTQITNYDTCTLSRDEWQLSRLSFKGTPCCGGMKPIYWQALVVGWACTCCHHDTKFVTMWAKTRFSFAMKEDDIYENDVE
jgi:hypothetical protein